MRPSLFCGVVACALSASAMPSAHHDHREAHANLIERATATSTSTASPTPTGKRGLAYNNATLTNMFANSSYITWAYDWGTWTDPIAHTLEYVPMLWGMSSSSTQSWSSVATSWLAKNSTHLLSFNEPDLGAQSNLSPAVAAQGYKTYMQPFAGKAKLGSPAVTNGPAPMGLGWLSSFLTACSGCTIDFVPLHWYSDSSQVAYFKQHLQDAHALVPGKPIWLTEFGVTDQGNEKAFLQEVLPWMDAQSWIERYAYFGVFEGVLVNGTKPSVYGKTYKHYPRKD